MSTQLGAVPPEGTPSLPTEGYLTAREAAEHLSLSAETVRAMCNDGALAGAVRKHGRWSIPPDAVEAWSRRQSEDTSGFEGSMAAQAEVPSVSPGKEPGPPAWWQRFRYNPWVFYPTVVISTLIVLVGVLFGLIQAGADFGLFTRQVKEWGLVREFPAERKGETLIVIARFYHSEGISDTGAHNEIRRAIENAAQELGETNLRVAVSSVPIAADDQDRAEKLGKQYDASIVIWGADTGVRVTVNFLNLKHPDFDAAKVQISETQRTQIANPSAYASFVTRDLPAQLSFLAMFAVGQSYYTQAAYENSITAIEKAITAVTHEGAPSVGLTEAYFRLGWLHHELNNYEQAIRGYTKAIELDPQLTMAYSNRGLAWFATGDLGAALQDFDRAIQLSPEFAAAYTGRGITRAARHDLDAAIQDYGKAIELDPQDVAAYVNRGNALYWRGKVADAFQDYDKAIQLAPRNPITYSNRGAVRYSQGDMNAAIQDCSKAIELAPSYADPYYIRGLARETEGDKTGAVADFRSYLEWAPDARDRQEVEQWIAELEQQLSKP